MKVKELPEARRRRLSLGHSIVDLDTHRIKTGNREVHLTPTECSLLEHLASHFNRTVPGTELVRALWGPDAGKGVHSLRVFIKSLRHKIEDSPARPRYIVTEPRIGYRLQVPRGDS
jgi:two-component system KDP operon response regulator KdpE